MGSRKKLYRDFETADADLQLWRGDVIDSAAFAGFTDAVERNRGIRERIMGGLFIVHLPEDSTFDPEAELTACVQRSRQPPNN